MVASESPSRSGQGSISETALIHAVEDNPGETAKTIAGFLDADRNEISNKLWDLENEGKIQNRNACHNILWFPLNASEWMPGDD